MFRFLKIFWMLEERARSVSERSVWDWARLEACLMRDLRIGVSAGVRLSFDWIEREMRERSGVRPIWLMYECMTGYFEGTGCGLELESRLFSGRNVVLYR